MSDKMREALERLRREASRIERDQHKYAELAYSPTADVLESIADDIDAALAEQPAQGEAARHVAVSTSGVQTHTGTAQGEAICRTDGRCQYAIDHGAEGLGFCPKGKCAMPAQGEAVARIRTLTKNSQFTGQPEGHAELIHWEDGIDALPDGEHTLYAAAPAPVVPDDAQLLNAVMDNCWKVEPVNVPTGGDDYSVSWRVVEFHMPNQDVEIARTRSDDPREAIREAIRLMIRRSVRAAMLAAAPEAAAPAVPDGWKLVPAEATEAMVSAVRAGTIEPQGMVQQARIIERIKSDYRKLLAAAPTVAAKGVQS